MGLLGRFQVLAGTIIGVGFVGVVFNEIGRDLIARVEEQDGPFSGVAGQVETIVPLVLAGLLLAAVLWFIASAIQEERSVNRRRIR